MLIEMYFPLFLLRYIEICPHIHKWLETRFIVRRALRQARAQAFPLTISLAWLSLPFSFPLLSLPPSLPPAVYRRPSISVVCQHAFSFGLLLQGARRWQITTRQPVIFDLSELSAPPPPSPAPRSRPGRHQSARAHTYSRLSDPPSISLLLHLLPPIHPFSIGTKI